MLGYQRVKTQELKLYQHDREQLLSLLHEVQDLRNSIVNKDDLIAKYEELTKNMNKECMERIGRMTSDHINEVEELQDTIAEYGDNMLEIEAFRGMKTAVIEYLKEDDLSGIPNEYKEMFIEWIEKTKYRVVESIAKTTEKTVHIVYKNGAITFANILIKHALD